MKLLKKNNTAKTLWEAWNDDKSKCYGVVGTVGDLLQAGILTYCDYSTDTWCFIAAIGSGKQNWFGKTRKDALSNI